MSPNLNLDKVDNWIFEAQIDEMRNFLGGKLYKLMAADWDNTLKKFVTPRFATLWEGTGAGDVIYFGLWRAIGFFSLANLIKNNAFNVTRFSNEELDSEITEQAREAAATTKASVATSQGIKMLNEVQIYIEGDPSVYPEFEIDIKEQPKTFEYLRVPATKPNLRNGF